MEPLDDDALAGNRDYRIVLGTRDSLPDAVRRSLPLAAEGGVLRFDGPDGVVELTAAGGGEAALAQVAAVDGAPLLSLTGSSTGKVREMVRFMANPANAGKLEGDLLAFRGPGAFAAMDSRETEVRTRLEDSLKATGERIWHRYRGYILLAAWVLVTVLFAKLLFFKKKSEEESGE
ncbi:MAG: hypothetical protein K9L28_11075 [Synergistales bacterium]|nr:hypothetical protein [Synergistales bacterium]